MYEVEIMNQRIKEATNSEKDRFIIPYLEL